MTPNQAPVYEVQPYEPKQPWPWHGIPVKIDLGDERGVCAGSVHLDMPDEPLQFPCFALFLDPAKALIIKGKDLEPAHDLNRNEGQSKLVPQRILTTADVNRNYRESPKGEQTIWIKGDETSPDPEAREPREVIVSEEVNRRIWEDRRERMKQMTYQSTNDAVRIGLGEFVKTTIEELERKPPPPIAHDLATHGELNLGRVLHAAGDQSWGPITSEDAQIWVKLL